MPKVFIYKGAGKKPIEGGDVCQRLCIRASRALQQCLAKRGYQEQYCPQALKVWRDCCAKAKLSEAEEATRGAAAAAAAAAGITAAGARPASVTDCRGDPGGGACFECAAGSNAVVRLHRAWGAASCERV